MIFNVSSLLFLFIYAARRYRECRERTAGEARASDGRNERQGHEQLFIFSFIYTLTIPFVYTCCPGRTRVSTQAR